MFLALLLMSSSPVSLENPGFRKIPGFVKEVPGTQTTHFGRDGGVRW